MFMIFKSGIKHFKVPLAGSSEKEELSFIFLPSRDKEQDVTKQKRARKKESKKEEERNLFSLRLIIALSR